MTQEIKIGVRVMCTDDGNLGVVTFVDIDEGKGINSSYQVKFDNGDEEWISADMIVLSDEPPYDKRKDFLQKLGALLKEYDAEIETYGCETGGVCLKVGDSCIYCRLDEYSPFYSITSDNIMNFEKK